MVAPATGVALVTNAGSRRSLIYNRSAIGLRNKKAHPAAFEAVYSSPRRHGPEPFAKRPIMSVTNHVPAGPIESLAL